MTKTRLFKQWQKVSFLLFALLMIHLIPAHYSVAQPVASDTTQLHTEAMIIVQKFSGALKPQLKKALQTGGPLQAIEICATRAPNIARTLSHETGWEVKRVSLKPRHQEAQPDTWETKVLQTFNQRQQTGEVAAEINFSELVNGRYRFMQAQGVEPLCLTCHGQQLAKEVEKTLKEYYPNDQATGYSLGQIRGAFSLTKQL
ncbi:MAG: DUF3365 domain-containing protein [Pseudomonadales bacterium]|nr:DUF3365 domain-containing protein [Pseudomonadales bacterium]